MEQVTVTWDLVAVDGLSLNIAASPLAPIETGVSMSLPLSSLPLKRFIQNTSLRGGFFQAHLYPAVMSVSWVPPPPNQSCQQQRRGAWIALSSRPQREGLLLASPQHPPHAFLFLLCLPWDLGTDHHRPCPVSACHPNPSGPCTRNFPSPGYEHILLKRVRKSWALAADPGTNPRCLIS